MKVLRIENVSKFLFWQIAIFIFGLTISAHGQSTTTFAQFFERTGSQDFVFTNNGSGGAFQTVPGGSAIFFLYQNINGLDPSLTGIQNAHLVISTTTTSPATQVLSPGLRNLQSFNQTTTIQILRDTPAPVGNGSRRNLLSITIVPNGASAPVLSGDDGSNSATFSASTPDHFVIFGSDFVSFASTNARNLALSFSSVTPALSLGAGNFLANFTGAGSGTFASNPVPVVAVPTAASVMIGGRVLTPAGRGLQNAQVSLTEPDGTTRTVTTNTLGYYRFADVQVGQAVTLAVSSKRYTFAPQVTTITEENDNLNFTAEP